MIPVFSSSIHEIRKGLISSIPDSGNAPEPRFLYTPVSHGQALDPLTTIVCGIRGAGKSTWTKALSNPDYRGIIEEALPRASLTPNWSVKTAFNEDDHTANHPNAEIIDDLLGKGSKPRDIWMSVIGHQLKPGMVPGSTWKARADWVSENLEMFYQAIDAIEAEQTGSDQFVMLVFDALDRCSTTWQGRRSMLKALFQIALQFRSRKRLRLKLFVRPDMLTDPEVGDFPDFSKLQANRSDLTWSRSDLFGLLWQYLANAASQSGMMFRDGISKITGAVWHPVGTTFLVDSKLRTSDDTQRKIFDALAGKWMGSNAKRGFPFTWLPNHLADSKGQVSPRSFLAALREAAKVSLPDGWQHPLHHEGIKQGVTSASKIRVDEITEDFSWVSDFMLPLRDANLLIPCERHTLIDAWAARGLLQEDSIRERSRSAKQSPRRLTPDGLGVIEDLSDLGLFSSLPDNRLQMPDVYRVAFGLGRKGGIPPVR